MKAIQRARFLLAYRWYSWLASRGGLMLSYNYRMAKQAEREIERLR